MKVSPARVAAFDALFRIETENVFSSVVLPLLESKLSPNDRSLCHEITLGVLRRKIYLDRIIDQLVESRKLDVEVRIALQIGLFQMIFLDRVPAHSAINESVELVGRARKHSAKGFVNALLRTFQRQPFTPGFADDPDDISVSTSHPRWIVERWINQLGFDEARELCEANNRSPNLSFRLVGNVEELALSARAISTIDDLKKSDLVDECFLVPRMSKTLSELAEEGRVYFQDEGSQLIGNAAIAEVGSRVIDVCAAPGGKTTMIAQNKASLVIAGDVVSSRVDRLRKTCDAHRAPHVFIVQYDAEVSLPFENETFDTVFVDAPCSGTGTIRHNPEIRYSLSPDDIVELSRKQLRILKNASELVKPGGTLVYSTCSIEQEENEAVSQSFLRGNLDFKLVSPNVPGRVITSDGFGRTFPHRDNVDGFFIAVFRRR